MSVNKRMVVMVLNFSGNVGKSVISRHFLEPRLNNAFVIPVETINTDEHETDAVKGNQFSMLLENMFSVKESIIVDVGASNIESLLGEMTKIVGSHEDFDYFIVPTVAKTKQKTDTIKTIMALNDLGVPSEKIRLIFNAVDDPIDVPRDFKSIFDYHAALQHFDLKPDAIIGNSELYGLLQATGKTIEEVLKDTTNFKEAISQSEDEAEKKLLARALTTQRLARGVNAELDAVFSLLFN